MMKEEGKWLQSVCGEVRKEDGLKVSLSSYLCRSVNEVTVQWVWLLVGTEMEYALYV